MEDQEAADLAEAPVEEASAAPAEADLEAVASEEDREDLGGIGTIIIITAREFGFSDLAFTVEEASLEALPHFLYLYLFSEWSSSASSWILWEALRMAAQHDEQEMQRYGLEQYSLAFSEAEEYEENILIAFLVNEERDDYYVYACVGDYLDLEVREMFGDEYTRFGAVTLSTVNSEYYEFSLSSNLADVMTKMAKEIEHVGGTMSVEPIDIEMSRVANDSSLAINEETVNRALKDFAERTGIGAVIVIEDMEELFGKSFDFGDVVVILMMVGLIVLGIVLIVNAVKSKKGGSKSGGSGESKNDEPKDRYNRDYNSGGRYNN